jgi:hypothetical protein
VNPYWRTISIGAVLALTGPSLAYAQAGMVQLAEKPFVESFVGNPRVSGNLLVGLHLGRSQRAFDPAGIRVPVSARFLGRPACVHVSTRDGRYSAENVYVLPKSAGAAALEMPSRYVSELARLTADDVAVTIRDVNSCRAAGFGTVVPAQLAAGEPARELVALVNPGFARVEARLKQGAREVVPATRCERIEGQVRIAFSVRCVLAAPAAFAPGSYQLELVLRESTSSETVPIAVLIP